MERSTNLQDRRGACDGSSKHMAKPVEMSFVGSGDEDSKTPLVVVPEHAAKKWRDDFAKKNTARARALKKDVALLDCGKFDVLVLGGPETCTAWLPSPNGGTLVRW